MEKFNKNDDFLARWASGALPEEEKEAFKKTEDYKLYKAILEGTDLLEVPSYDKEKLYAKVKENRLEDKRVVFSIPRWAYAAAASIAVLLGLFYFMNQPTTVSTGFGEQLAVVLPDGSEVMLNAKSTLKYNERNWQKERVTRLEGEAYFKVKKGSSFKVLSNESEVKVLGTEFNVNANENFYQVLCYEGKVEVKNSKEKTILTKGLAYRNSQNEIEKFNFNEETPSWIQGESTFKNVPLVQVIDALEKQFNVKIKYKQVNVKRRFTGSFNHKDLGIALRTVFSPMKISYTFENEKTIILVKD